MFEETEVVTQVVGDSILDVAFEGILPVGAAVAAAHHVGSRFETKEKRLGYGALARHDSYWTGSNLRICWI